MPGVSTWRSCNSVKACSSRSFRPTKLLISELVLNAAAWQAKSTEAPPAMAIGRDDPKNLTATDNKRRRLVYAIPNFFSISSSGTPFVSGTMTFTQISCSTIMQQKNVKM